MVVINGGLLLPESEESGCSLGGTGSDGVGGGGGGTISGSSCPFRPTVMRLKC